MSTEEDNTPESNSGDSAKRGSRKKRRRRTREPATRAIVQKPFAQPVRLSAPVDLASAEAVEKIHHASLKVLAETCLLYTSDAADE